MQHVQRARCLARKSCSIWQKTRSRKASIPHALLARLRGLLAFSSWQKKQMKFQRQRMQKKFEEKEKRESDHQSQNPVSAKDRSVPDLTDVILKQTEVLDKMGQSMKAAKM